MRPFQSDFVPPLPPLVQQKALNALETARRAGMPVDFEIGCGAGMHPLQRAGANPDRVLIAVEHTKTKFAAFREHLRKSERALPNLVPLRCNAISFLTHPAMTELFGQIFLLYPNPEPQAKNRRWFRAPVMARILETLKTGGTITLATNVQVYFDEALEFAERVWGLKVLEKRKFDASSAPAIAPRTHFEKKYLERGAICFEAIFQKTPVYQTQPR